MLWVLKRTIDGSFEHPEHAKIMGKKKFTILRWKSLFI